MRAPFVLSATGVMPDSLPMAASRAGCYRRPALRPPLRTFCPPPSIDDMNSMHRPFAVAAILVCTIGCESSTAPRPNDRSIAFGSSVSGSVGPADTVVYQLKVKAGQIFAVYLDALDSTLLFQVKGANGIVLGTGSSSGPGTFAQWTRIRADN